MKQELCRLINVNVVEDGESLLRHIDLYILRGERVAFVGLHGSGKSMLAKVIAGLRPRSNGTIFWQGEKRKQRHVGKLQKGCFYIYEDSMLAPSLSVVDNLIALGENKKTRYWYRKKPAIELTKAVFHELGVAIDPNRLAGELSTLQSIIVQIAKAVCNDSQLIIIDITPHTLAQEEIEILQQVIFRCRDRAVIYVANVDDAISKQCDRVIVMRSCSISGVFYKDSYDSVRLWKYIAGYDSVERKKVTPNSQKKRQLDRPVLEIRNVHRLCRSMQLPFRLKVNAGEIVGLVDMTKYIGEDFISALLKKNYEGNVFVAGVPVSNYREAVRAGLVLMHLQNQKSYQFPCFDLEENLTFQMLRKISKHGLIDGKLRNHISDEYKSKLKKTTGSDSEKWYLLQMMYYRCIATSPKALVLDYMIQGLHPLCQQEFIGMLREATAGGAGILLAFSELATCYEICDRVYILHQNHYSIFDKLQVRETIKE